MKIQEHSLTEDGFRREFFKLLDRFPAKYNRGQVFRDFVEISAISIANSCTVGTERDNREKRYLDIVGRYDSNLVREVFPAMFANVVCALESLFCDYLGQLFMQLEIGSSRLGQFYTPYPLSVMMASITFDKTVLETKQFITVSEPACGAGGMIIALAEVIKTAGICYQDKIWVQAVDLDPTSVFMCYIQLSLLGIAAEVIHGNSLSLDVYSRWHTPVHILENWFYKLKFRQDVNAMQSLLVSSNNDVDSSDTSDIELKLDAKPADFDATEPTNMFERLLFEPIPTESQLDLFGSF